MPHLAHLALIGMPVNPLLTPMECNSASIPAVSFWRALLFLHNGGTALQALGFIISLPRPLLTPPRLHTTGGATIQPRPLPRRRRKQLGALKPFAVRPGVTPSAFWISA